MVSKLINASFPDYESVIPKDNDQIMSVDCKSFSETIDRVSTISDEKFRTVNPKTFGLYLQFLSSKNLAYLYNAEREAE